MVLSCQRIGWIYNETRMWDRLPKQSMLHTANKNITTNKKLQFQGHTHTSPNSCNSCDHISLWIRYANKYIGKEHKTNMITMYRSHYWQVVKEKKTPKFSPFCSKNMNIQYNNHHLIHIRRWDLNIELKFVFTRKHIHHQIRQIFPE